MNKFFDVLVCSLIVLALMLLIPISICALLVFMLADYVDRFVRRKGRRSWRAQ